MFAESCTIQIIIWNGVCLSTADPPIVDSKFVFPMFFFIYEQITLGPCVMSWPGQQCSIDQIFFLFIPASCFQLQFTLTPNWICIFFIMWISINFLFLHFWQRHTISESIFIKHFILSVCCVPFTAIDRTFNIYVPFSCGNSARLDELKRKKSGRVNYLVID